MGSRLHKCALKLQTRVLEAMLLAALALDGECYASALKMTHEVLSLAAKSVLADVGECDRLKIQLEKICAQLEAGDHARVIQLLLTAVRSCQ